MLALYPVSYAVIRMSHPIKFCNDRIVVTPNDTVAKTCIWLYMPLIKADRQLTGTDMVFFSPTVFLRK